MSAFVVLTIILLWHWVRDLVWMVGASKEEFAEYLDELEDVRDPKPDPSRLMTLFYRLRSMETRPANALPTTGHIRE